MHNGDGWTYVLTEQIEREREKGLLGLIENILWAFREIYYVDI